MKTDILLHQTRIHFPRFDADGVKIVPIEKGGSGRRFYRVQSTADQKLILVKYSLDREENRQYVEIARFLESHGIRAPKIYFHDPDEGLIWIEDLGEEDLYSHREESWLVRRAMYESALDEAAKLHRIPETQSAGIRSKLPAEFNAALYLWEQNYFFENCLGRYFKIEGPELRRLAALPALQHIAQELDALPRVLVHRDFQSQNIIVRNGQAYLIDFQGMRPGLAEYDLASLLFDPYVQLSTSETTELIDYYCSRREGMDEAFKMTLSRCAVQRLMQALGAYGFLGLVKGQSPFLAHVPRALQSLRCVTETVNGLEPLAAKLEEISSRCPAEVA